MGGMLLISTCIHYFTMEWFKGNTWFKITCSTVIEEKRPDSINICWYPFPHILPWSSTKKSGEKPWISSAILCPAHRHLGSHRILRASCQADKDHPHFWRNLSYLLWWYVSQTNPLISSQIVSNCTAIMVGVSNIDTEIDHSYIISMCIYSVYIYNYIYAGPQH